MTEIKECRMHVRKYLVELWQKRFSTKETIQKVCGTLEMLKGHSNVAIAEACERAKEAIYCLADDHSISVTNAEKDIFSPLLQRKATPQNPMHGRRGGK